MESTGVTHGAHTRTELRKFGLTVGLAFCVLAAIARWRGHAPASAVLAALGVALITGGLAAPAALAPVERAWMGMAHAISKVTTPIFMGIVYFVVLTPVGLLRRALGKNPLRHRAREDSYWVDRGSEPASDLKRQF